MITCDIAIVGAGPYGLSAAAHLKAANGLDVRVFGEPMSFWEKHMPKWMLLRSPLAGSHLSDPEGSLSLQGYQAETGNGITSPLPLSRFIEYGRWFQSKAVPDSDPRKIERVDRNGIGFQVTVQGGEVWKVRRVIVAAGIEICEAEHAEAGGCIYCRPDRAARTPHGPCRRHYFRRPWDGGGKNQSPGECRDRSGQVTGHDRGNATSKDRREGFNVETVLRTASRRRQQK